MPWFKIDDSSHSHPKFRRAGNAALGLWVRCGAYSAQHLTEGHIPGDLAREYGTEPQIKKLIKVGLWHAHGHDCERCPQPHEAGDYIVHDFFEGGRNTTKVQHEANKKQAAERAAKSRAAKKPPRIEPESDPNRARIEPENAPNRARNDPLFQDSTAGQDGLSQRTPADGVTHTHAAAMPYRSTSYGSTAAAGTPASGASDSLTELKGRISAAGLGAVGWQLSTKQWAMAKVALDRVGIDVMVQHAVGNARQRGIPTNASAWIESWYSLHPPAAAPPPSTEVSTRSPGDVVVQFPPPGSRPSTTDQRVQQALDAGARLQAMLDAQGGQQ